MPAVAVSTRPGTVPGPDRHVMSDSRVGGRDPVERHGVSGQSEASAAAMAQPGRWPWTERPEAQHSGQTPNELTGVRPLH
jgi:hypothetical protein